MIFINKSTDLNHFRSAFLKNFILKNKLTNSNIPDRQVIIQLSMKLFGLSHIIGLPDNQSGQRISCINDL